MRYDNHEREWQNVLSDPARAKVGDTWFRSDTLDAWRHERMRAPLLPVIAADPEASWLTVGDGRYGTDAHFLLSHGARHVHCSDISETLLRIGNEKGFIQEYSAQNAEALSFADESFDYVYCKESFHHFPRPYLALYEMFRVARRAVILTEPRDPVADSAPLGFVFAALKRLAGRKSDNHVFETVGNYLYSVSEREFDKFLLGMHHTHVAYAGCNDAYSAGVEFVPLAPTNAAERKVKQSLQRKIALRDWLCRAGLARPMMISATLFKQAPSAQLAEAMRAGGWDMRTLPANPYL